MLSSNNYLATLTLTLVLILLSGCNTISAKKSEPVSDGRILIMPPRNVVQAGQPHPAGVDSGLYLQQKVVEQIDKGGRFTVQLNDNQSFNNYALIDSSAALAEAAAKNVEYLLILELGEFRDAAPFTFRSDYVTLQKGELYSVKSGQVIWQLDADYRLEQSNLGVYKSLIDSIAIEVVNSIQG